ncbi:methyl-accepting chemotaxis protein [Pseudomonas cannabina]|uniref:Methyl-accepting chemotaxis protein n=1 Tax=Pseudomonas cannabina TaxID=86840 RepID=A0A0P9LBU4_PSECA|nr:Methyl-accepting chemotaxis protein [Pseudomonas cannabina]RMN22933.1 Methyl-accepting chemotaxis protein [Pseudomonas cannabina]
MFRLINHALGNMNVRFKLSLGFGLVLLLTLIITLTGWHGLYTMIDRSESLSDVAQLTSLTKDLRADRITDRVQKTPETTAQVIKIQRNENPPDIAAPAEHGAGNHHPA